MSQISAGHPIVTRLTNLRKRVRVLLSVHGISLVVATLLATLIVLVTFDFLIHLDGPTRLVLGVLAFAGLIGLAYRRMIMPLSTKLTDQFLAGRVELVNANLADELISAVHFIKHGTPQGNALAAKAVEAAEARARGVRFEDALDFRPALRMAGIAGILLAIVALVAIANPEFAKIAAGRWFSPLAKVEWWKVMNIEFVWDKQPDGKQPSVLPEGEAVDIRVRLTGPSAMNRRVYLYQSADGKAESWKLMQCQTGESDNKNAIYSMQIAPQDAKNITLRAVAVDDSKTISAHLARRPQVTALDVEVTPPSYVTNGSVSSINLVDQRGVVIARSHMKLIVRANNPIGITDKGEPDVHFLDSAKETPMPVTFAAKFSSADQTSAELEMDATVSLAARVQVKDVNGFVNQTGGNMVLDVVPDAIPTVSIDEPRGSMRVVPEAIIPIKNSATDDLGFVGGKWRVENFDQKAGDEPIRFEDKPWGPATKDQAGNSLVSTEFKWSLAELKLKPGDHLAAFAMALDNYSVDGKTHDWARSPALSVTIISLEELKTETKAQLMETKARVEALAKAQKETRAKTETVKNAINKMGQATTALSQQLANLTAEESIQTGQSKALSEQFDKITKNLEINQLKDDPLAKAADSAKAVMKDVGENNMSKAAGALNKAAEQAGKDADKKQDPANPQKSENAEQATEQAGKASEQQGQAVGKMEELSKALDAFNGLNTIKENLDKAIAAQKAITGQIDQAGSKTRGKDLADLTKEEKDNLKKIADLQKDLQDKTAELKDQMGKMAQQSTDPAEKKSLEESVKAGEKADVSGNQNNAGNQAKDNKTSSASSSSSAAAAGLEKMKEELDKIAERKLEELSQKLADLIKMLEIQKAAEEGIKTATEQVGEKATVEMLAPILDKQGRAHLNTDTAKRAAAAVKEAEPAVPFIGDAVDQMLEAATTLGKGKQKESIPPEAESISSLNRAIAKLKEIKKPVDDNLKEKDLTAFIAKYKEILKDQTTIKTAVTPMKKNAGGELERADSLALAEMTGLQSKNIKALTEVANDPKLKPFDAIVFINGQILDYMGESEKRLGKAMIGRELNWNQQKAVDRLADIIKALEEEKAKKEEFDKPPGDSPSGNGGGKPPLIKASQQLRLLKMMQTAVNEDTTKFNEYLVATKEPAEATQIKDDVEKLGGTQGKIKDVAKNIFDKLKEQ